MERGEQPSEAKSGRYLDDLAVEEIAAAAPEKRGQATSSWSAHSPIVMSDSDASNDDLAPEAVAVPVNIDDAIVAKALAIFMADFTRRWDNIARKLSGLSEWEFHFFLKIVVLSLYLYLSSETAFRSPFLSLLSRSQMHQCLFLQPTV